MRRLLVFLPLLLLLFGCSEGPKPLYHYEDYSARYYDFKKNPSPQSAEELMKTLQRIIDRAPQSASMRVPPGIHAHLGYMYLQQGALASAKAQFLQEKAIYPEATQFMDRLIAQIDAKESHEAH
ncbi:MAG: DUF4810 domain-containing protein [Campylobacterales bacterium]|nr:DUF4810 domain-containing protein [Campylobacterales bacterium]